MAASVVSLLLFGSLAACSGDSDGTASPSASSDTEDAAASEEPTAADVAALEGVEVAGDAGAEPTLTFTQPLTVSVPTARVTSEGTGADLAEGQILTMNYIAVSGADGSTQGTTYGAAADHITLGDASLITALNTVLTGQKVGTRILLAIPGTAATADAAETPTTVMAVEVSAAKDIPNRAEGEAVAPVAGLPTVALGDDGAPTITAATGEAPTALVVQPLIKGAGAAVTAGQTVTFQYTGALWDGTVFDSSWENGAPFTTSIGTGAVIPGWDEGLVGQTVGSQVLLVVPPDKGYGETEQGSIPANSTLVFVVDILDAS
ncbi:FKBP-type peptidyl-prolyl cis-trans isomerase [Pengzhenrongella sicca]|uniref:FKBP-type peptidyl-prolyl cis-trans isomerase n=1 Tax=Pengzhenrongella sicca TaxID=2819238 RepID=UPI001D0CBBFE|nr:FKBP-type peptidyl-prolyl cis-trans isomerase [Pengzhenrongella sicca]